MTINNLQLNEEIVKLHRSAGELDYLTREGKEKLLLIALGEIEDAAKKAKLTLLALKFSKLYP